MLEKLIKRLQARKIIMGSGCWEIPYVTDTSGYIQIKYKGKAYSIHRISAAYYLNLDLNSDLLALHKNECNNRKCWNPEHLYIGKVEQNVKDSIKLKTHFDLGEYNSNKFKNQTHCAKGHIRIKKGSCPECNKIRVREFMRNKRKKLNGTEKGPSRI